MAPIELNTLNNISQQEEDKEEEMLELRDSVKYN
jgi:hypothetical protein